MRADQDNDQRQGGKAQAAHGAGLSGGEFIGLTYAFIPITYNSSTRQPVCVKDSIFSMFYCVSLA